MLPCSRSLITERECVLGLVEFGKQHGTERKQPLVFSDLADRLVEFREGPRVTVHPAQNIGRHQRHLLRARIQRLALCGTSAAASSFRPASTR